jgi:NADH:ubiquinone oxidoreductase subunit B-like Fe-S oxidoreductase
MNDYRNLSKKEQEDLDKWSRELSIMQYLSLGFFCACCVISIVFVLLKKVS